MNETVAMQGVPTLLRAGAGLSLAGLAAAGLGWIPVPWSSVAAALLLATPWLGLAALAKRAASAGRRRTAWLALVVMLAAVGAALLVGFG